MKVLVGLGNPGEKYKNNRHNVGFQIADLIADKYSNSKWTNKFKGSFCTCWLENEKFLILKPETFMNNSGQSVQSLANFYKLKPSDLIIFHDDLDLVVGRIKLKHSGSHAGHNGLKSIHQIFGNEYVRVRVGIDRPKDKKSVSSYVLSDFTTSDAKYIKKAKNLILYGTKALVSDDYNSFNKMTEKKSTQPEEKTNIEVKDLELKGIPDSSIDKLSKTGKSLSFLGKLLKKTI